MRRKPVPERPAGSAQKVMQVNLTSLVERVKQRGERDNISAVLIQVGRETC